jgi:dienelactone hydrolase
MAPDLAEIRKARYRRWSRRLAALGVLMLVAWATYASWVYENDPFRTLAAPQEDLEASVTQLGSRDARRMVHIVLPSDRLGDVGLTISFPDPLPAGKLPVLIVLGGLGTGEENIDYLKGMGDNVLVGYDWPLPEQFPRINSIASQIDLASRIPGLYRRIMRVPPQVASAIDWIVRQPWADGTRISLLGFSLGALVAPAIEDVAEHSGLHIGWTIIAYGGAPLGGVLASAIANSKQHMWYEGLLPPLLDLLLSPLQPTRHLPALHSHFLVLEGQDDERFPEALRARLRQAVPDPKDVIVLEGPHLGLDPKKLALLDRAIEVSKHWLIESGAANVP